MADTTAQNSSVDSDTGTAIRHLIRAHRLQECRRSGRARQARPTPRRRVGLDGRLGARAHAAGRSAAPRLATIDVPAISRWAVHATTIRRSPNPGTPSSIGSIRLVSSTPPPPKSTSSSLEVGDFRQHGVDGDVCSPTPIICHHHGGIRPVSSSGVEVLDLRDRLAAVLIPAAMPPRVAGVRAQISMGVRIARPDDQQRPHGKGKRATNPCAAPPPARSLQQHPVKRQPPLGRLQRHLQADANRRSGPR